MEPSDRRDRILRMAIGLLLIFGPVAILVFTVYLLTLTGELLVGRLTVKRVEHRLPVPPDTAAETTEEATPQTDSSDDN